MSLSIAVSCPRCSQVCTYCGREPAVHLFSGPTGDPANPGKRTIVFRCALHPLTQAEFPHWEGVPFPGIRQYDLTRCGAEMVLPISSMSPGEEPFLDGDIPGRCPKGHRFTSLELAQLGLESLDTLKRYVESGEYERDLGEARLTQVET